MSVIEHIMKQSVSKFKFKLTEITDYKILDDRETYLKWKICASMQSVIYNEKIKITKAMNYIWRYMKISMMW